MQKSNADTMENELSVLNSVEQGSVWEIFRTHSQNGAYLTEKEFLNLVQSIRVPLVHLKNGSLCFNKQAIQETMKVCAVDDVLPFDAFIKALGK